MKKTVLFLLALILVSACALAVPSGNLPYGPGAKFAAMGGAGSALVDDILSSYYNPAGMAQSKFGFDLSAGAATAGFSDMMNVFANSSNPAKFFSDNYNKDVNVNGSISALLGFNAAGIGISVMPVGSMFAVKPANNTSGSISGNGLAEGILTVSHGFSIPSIPFLSSNLNVGANIKYISNASGSSTMNSPLQSTDSSTATTGMGYDLGLQSSIQTPVMPIYIGIVLKDISESMSGTTTNTTTTYNTSGNIASQTSTTSNAPVTASPTTFVIGAATKIPVVGLKVAADLDSVSGSGTSYSVTHLGLEYPLAMGLIALRAGIISGGSSASPINMVTYGAGLFANVINIAMVADNNNSKNNQMIVDVNLGF